MTSADQIKFTAPDGTRWTVHEVSNSTDQSWSGKSLIFVSDEGFRRVRTYPSNWRELSAADLFALSWKR